MNRTLISILAALALVTLAASTVQAAPATMSREAIADLANASVGYSYWWGHGRWRLDGASHGSCSGGGCPSCTHSGSYGADCSGMVGKAWQVPSPSPVTSDAHPYSTYNFRNEQTHWTRINRDNSERADALVYNSGGSGHVVLYDRRDSWGSVSAWECKGCSYGCVHNVRSISASYIAIRRNALGDSPGGDDTGGDPGDGGSGLLQGVVYQDVGVGTADMSRRIPGATVRVSNVSLTTDSPDAYWSTHMPSGTYTVTASASGYQTNSRSCAVSSGSETWCSVGLYPVGGGGGGEGDDTPPDTSGDSDGMGTSPGGDAGEDGATGDDADTGGDDGTGGGGDGTGDVIIDPDSPHGTVKGYVIEMTLEADTLEGCDGPHVPGAKVEAENTESTVADGDGYFEFLVLEGEHVLGASKEGYLTGAAECTVVAGGEVTCCIPIVKDPNVTTPDEDDIGAEAVIVVGCASSGEAGGLLLVPTFVILCALALRRRSAAR
ncbi:MAG TPA: carboxypeptidase regulatory-like domain-containing protein [Myxococcota bacterium]|nr:carboxypeptidase regulatory-like domain-containing protein [Myxococcota bacterium]HRY95709.1 carboxypeptidase regulatory-like domain-containing protein [Myxococcota bacterium]